jgi:hypothetical protein
VNKNNRTMSVSSRCFVAGQRFVNGCRVLSLSPSLFPSADDSVQFSPREAHVPELSA